MSFADIQGQDKAVSFLKGSIESGRISHAYIFYGPGGVGKRLVAMNFAKAVSCLGRADAPCDGCAQCGKIDSSNHPDVTVVRPEKEGGSIAVDAVRAVIKDASLKPYEAKKKFYIIDEADRMKEEAANALLKTLEEPPSDSVFILIAESLTKLLPTIVSRSQTVKFFSLRADEVKDILVKRYDIDPGKAYVASRLSAGRPGDALKYADKEFLAKRDKVMTALANGTFFESDFDKLTKTDLRAYLAILLTWYRDILIAKVGPASGRSGSASGLPEVINIDWKDAITAAAANTASSIAEQMIGRIISTYSFMEQNANPKLAMAALGISA